MLMQGYDDDEIVEHLTTPAPSGEFAGHDSARTECTERQALAAVAKAYTRLNDRPNDARGWHVGIRRYILQQALTSKQLHVALAAVDSLADMEGVAYGFSGLEAKPPAVHFHEVEAEKRPSETDAESNEE